MWLAVASGPGNFEKRVVIKTVLPELSEKPGYVDMLVNEASLAARLNHPNIIQVFDLGCIDGIYFIAMEYLPGKTLAQILKRTVPQTPEWMALSVMAACCDGLHYAHELCDDSGKPLGLLHRDISPGNIMVTFTGRVAVLDFGIAVANRGEQTMSGTLKGKYHYMAPERIAGEPADRKSDVYSLGVILYLLLTGARPFAADGEYELLRSIIAGRAAPVRSRAPWISPNLEAIVSRAIMRDPSRRYASCQQLASDLRAHLRTWGNVREPRELGAYLGELFPDAADLPSGLTPRPPAMPPGELAIHSLLVPALGSGEGIGDLAIGGADDDDDAPATEARSAATGSSTEQGPGSSPAGEGDYIEISLVTGDVEAIESEPEERDSGHVAAGSEGMAVVARPPLPQVFASPRTSDDDEPELTSIYDTARPMRKTPGLGIDVFEATRSMDDRERIADIFGRGMSANRGADRSPQSFLPRKGAPGPAPRRRLNTGQPVRREES